MILPIFAATSEQQPMTKPELELQLALRQVILHLYGKEIEINQLQVQPTRKEFEGDFTLVVFPLLKISGKNPEQTAKEIGEALLTLSPLANDFNVVKGFLNIRLKSGCWIQLLNDIARLPDFGYQPKKEQAEKVMVEFSSPNTNKPLHLGHIRNILLGDSICRILKANGKEVYAVNLVNDRGIHICKSMLAWQQFGNQCTPESSQTKGDHLVGDFYVRFDQEYRKEIKVLVDQGTDEEIAKKEAPLMIKAQEMLRKWESGDPETIRLWKTMNSWVYKGFDQTYDAMRIRFDKTYYESETYTLGKEFVLQGVKNGSLDQDSDRSIWADLSADGLDRKLLLRSDGTSVYMTQDVGTAYQRFHEYTIDQHLYVVGNEQNYHFQVLKLVLKKLGFDFADKIVHLSYGMVELPDGKMKSREGKVVDADDLIEEMIATAKQSALDSAKLAGLSEDEFNHTIHQIALAALKYFILKVDPKKNMTFSPEESIDFNGNTGPFIQYAYARIQSVLRSAGDIPSLPRDYAPMEVEISLIKLIADFPQTVHEAGAGLSPAMIANYLYNLSKEFNRFYHDCPILKADTETEKVFRLLLSQQCARVIHSGLDLLGIEAPERM
jgi:arginyl-tRNA synthetase